MTLVNMKTLASALNLPEMVDATAVATYWAGYDPYLSVEGDEIIFPRPITIEFTAGVPAESVEMVPTRGVSCVQWKLSSPGIESFTFYTTIPDQAEIDFADLPRVDRRTFAPSDESLAGWTEAAETATVARDEAVAAAAGFSDIRETVETGRLSEDELNTTIAELATDPVGDVVAYNDGRYIANGAPIAKTIESGLGSTAMTFLGDSLDNEDHEGFPLFIAAVVSAGLATAFEVREQRWDHDNQRMPRPIVRQAAPAGARHIQFAGANDQSPKWNVVTSPVGDLDIRALIEPTSWGAGSEQVILACFPAATNRAWNFSLSGSGALNFQWSTDGTVLQTIAASGAWTPGAGAVWVRVTLDVDNGATQHDVKFWRSTDGETWTQVGTTVTRSGVTSVFASSSPLQIGERGSGTGKLIGKVYEVSVRDGIGDAAEITPNLPEHWKATPATPSPVGSPILTFVNSAHPGATFTYLSDDARVRKMLPMWGVVTMGYRSSHNESSVHGEELRAILTALDAKVNLRYPAVAKFIDTENPRISPATRSVEQALRRTEYITWAAAWGWRVMDGYGAFLTDGRAVSALVNSDGFHPNVEGSKIRARLLGLTLGIPVTIA